MTIRVLVLDDDPHIAEIWLSEIAKVVSEEYELLPLLNGKDFRESVRELVCRHSAAREGKRRKSASCPFDAAEILVIDYDLLHVDKNSAQYSGEEIGRLARMFSNCAVVVILNQFPGTDFDLSLRGHLDSCADMNIDAKVLSTPGLWRPPPWDGFRPWTWETLSTAVNTQRARETLVRQHLNNPIAETFGMTEEDVEHLSDTAYAFVAQDAKDFSSFQDVTFLDSLRWTSNKRDIEALLEVDTLPIVRLAAARIGKWLETEVLGPQEVLIDIPHLVQRFPFIVGDQINELPAWNDFVYVDHNVPDVINEDCFFQPNNVLSRMAVWAQRFQRDPEVRRQRREYDFSHVPDFVFAEDISRFIPLQDASEFRAGFHNFYNRRFVAVVDEMRYMPQRLFAFGSV